MYLVLCFIAPHDKWGNPRRISLVHSVQQSSNSIELVDIIDEGYAGKSEVNAKYPNHLIIGTFDIYVSEYNRLKKKQRSADING